MERMTARVGPNSERYLINFKIQKDTYGNLKLKRYSTKFVFT